MKAVAIFLSVLTGVLALEPVPFQVREINNETLWMNVETKIYGGAEAKEGQFPFMVFVLMKLPQGVSQCSASLIEPNWVLLAAHCVHFKNLNSRDVIVVGGRVNMMEYVKTRMLDYYADINEARLGVQERRAKRFITHPKYDETELQHDVALIELPKPFELNPIKTISLSKSEITSPQRCTILGWGLTLGNLQSFKLNFVENKMVKNTKLGCLHKPSGPFICLVPDNRGICQGDSGSPLVCDGKVWGVASHFVSRSTNPDCGDSMEEYYTELYGDLDWIGNTINGGFKSVVMNPKGFLLCVAVFLWSAMRNTKLSLY